MKAILVEFTGEQELEDTIQTLKDVLKGKTIADMYALSNNKGQDLLNNLIFSLEKNRRFDYSIIKDIIDDDTLEQDATITVGSLRRSLVERKN